MKRYLNKEEKNTVLVLGSFVSYFAEKIEEFDKLGINKDILKCFRLARTWGDKALQKYMEKIDPIEQNNVLLEVKKMTVSSTYKSSAIREYKEMLALDSVIPVPKDDFYDLVGEVSSCVCRNCRAEGAEVDTCPLRSLFLRNNVDAVNAEVSEGKCPYQY